ncbi:MAG: hypothetical protein IBJ03_09935 [Gemmatimonadaceae bacterium]|nr:hypothetical protein [Gemmatimonadaceae bacterium]
MRIIRTTLALTALVAGATACGSDNPGPNQAGDVGIGFRLAQSSSSSNLMAGFTAEDGTPVTVAAATAEPTPLGFLISRDDDELLVTKAQIVIKNVKLKRTSASCDDDDDDDRGSNRRDDGCPTMHVGPYLVDMAVTGVDGGRLSGDLPGGSYSAGRFDIHKVTSSRSDDLAFRQAHPDFRDISVRLEGTYNGTPFTFVSDVNAKLDVPLPEPLAIGGDIDNITVTIDVGSWFVNTSGGLYSPALANTPGLIRARVDNNIRFAFKAFRDKNRDGRKD